ncbi:hypothetical protein P7F60_11990 [Rhizobium sp. YJ-22]|uniref:hypothetical protein n=1 Tax=Rhizobium sp. YJ-22 TaxID=3037556 RepID=UPI0024122FFF|nr:hypothetical protein [Rhizobium sp. YJ-22]MDG3577113.1 hypothetical protein [Rhizobium sp. YJ-22]
MAFTGLHIACGSYVSDTTNTFTRQPIFGEVVWSETLTSTGVTTSGASSEKPVIRFKSDADWWVAIGLDPNPAQDPRILIQAGVIEDIGCKPGEFIAGMPA